MTLNELKEFIAQQAEKFHAIENIEEWQWELVEFGTFKKIFDFVVANGYFQPSKEQLEEIEGEGWSLISAMEAVDEQKN